MLSETLKIANEPGLWICCSVMVVVMLVMVVLYFKLSQKTAKKINFPQKEVTKAFKSGMITAFGPSISSFLVVVSMIAVLGGPIAWQRLSVIGAVGTEMAASSVGASTAGLELGAENFSLEALALCFWTMAINGCGWMLMATVATGGMDKIREKMAGGDMKWMPVLTAAATIGAFANLSTSKAVAGGGSLVAVLAGAVSMLVFSKLSKKYKWIKSYKLAFSLIVGTFLAAVTASLY